MAKMAGTKWSSFFVFISLVSLIGIPGYYLVGSNITLSSIQQIVSILTVMNETDLRDDVININNKSSEQFTNKINRVFSSSIAQMAKMIDNLNPASHRNQVYILGNKTGSENENKTKVIMFWTTWYSNKMWFKLPKSALGRSLFKPKYCKHTNCILTNDHSRLKEADVLLFFGPPNWPKIRYPHQYYAHFMHEAPGRRHSGTLLDVYNGKINLTINFRHDADVHVPYNMFVARDKPITYKPRFPLANKTKMAVWPVSHCKTLSQREDYVKELSKYVEVDIFGGCGKYKCPRGSSHTCLEKWERSYKFFLSFENIFCDDYISEKLFKTLEHEIIPVVLGGGNYTRDAPPHSVINILDFSSPKALADYLIELGKDEERYYSYFKWKSDYEMAEIYSIMMCRLCDGLHENKFPRGHARTHYADYWYGPHGERCDLNKMSKIRKGIF